MKDQIRWWVGMLLVGAAALAACQSLPGRARAATATPVPTAGEPEALPTNAILFPYDASVLFFAEAEDRAAYQVMDLSQYNDFFQSMELSRLENFKWGSDPLEIATRLEGWPPTALGCKNKKVYFLPSEAGSVILIFTSDGCPDDSLAARKIRIEMHEDDGRWMVDWMGRMWMCARGEIESRRTEWHTYLCP